MKPSSDDGLGALPLALLVLGVAGGSILATYAFLASSRAREAEASALLSAAHAADRAAEARSVEALTRPRDPAAPPASNEQPVADGAREDGKARARLVEDEDPSASGQLLERARDGLRRGWRSVRADEMPEDQLAHGLSEYELLLRSAAEALGRQLAERRSESEAALEDLERGGAFALMERLDEGNSGPVVELASSVDELEVLFERSAGEISAPGVNYLVGAGERLEEGTTLQFPSGVFAIKDLMSRRTPFPSDVTLAGSGMNATLLVLGDISSPSRVRNLALEDCTVFTDNAPLFDLRREPVTLRLDRVRLIGFDSGAGGSNLLEAPGMVVFARDCHFEGGYGRSQSRHTSLFDVRSDALVGRFERCRVFQVSLELRSFRPGSTLVFEDCDLREILDDSERFAENLARLPGVVVSGSMVSHYDWEQGRPPHRDLNDLFPDWQSRIQR